MLKRLGIVCLGLCLFAFGGEVEGVVRNALTAEGMGRVRVAVGETATVTDSAGRFRIRGIPQGDYTVQVSAVGFRTVRKAFTLTEGGSVELSVVVSPDTFAVTDSVEVRADAFELSQAGSATLFALDATEIKELGSVLADDPLRSVHALPGVAANDDFNAQFSVHSAPFHRVGIYVDGVLLHTPFHSVEMEGSAGGSTTVFNGDMIGGMAVETGAFPARYGDRTAGVLDIETREGSRTGPLFRASATASSASLLGEGPLGKRGSWLGSVRKSYLQYIIARTSLDEPSLVFGFQDAQGRLTYDVTRRNTLTLSAMDGTSDLDRSRWRERLGINSAMTGRYRFTVGNLGWVWTGSDRVMVTSRAAWMREATGSANVISELLGKDNYGEFAGNSTASVMMGPQAPLEFGVSVRRIRGSGFSDVWTGPGIAVRDSEIRGAFVRSGGFVQQGFGLLGGKVRVSAGGRWDRGAGATVFSPQASVALLPFGGGTRISLSWGQYAQWPGVEAMALRPERAIQYVAAFEQRLGDRARLRVQAWDREDRDLVGRGLYDPRITGTGAVFVNDWRDPFRNSMRGYARGVEVLLQRRTANRLTGWVSYGLSWAKSRDGLMGGTFWSDYDQRHAVNVYLGYRVSPTVTLATRTSYGSGMPVPGFYRSLAGTYWLDSGRNRLRLPAYERTDVRLDKAWVREKWKMTLYAEVANVLNRRNLRFDSYDGHDGGTGRTWISINTMLPVLPTAGVMVEF